MSRRSGENLAKRGRRPVLALLSAVAIAGLMAACSAGGDPGDAGSTPPAADNIAIGFASDPATTGFDPAANANGGGGGLTTLWQGLYDSLFAPTADGSIQPSLATDYAFNDEKTELTLTLRDDVAFTDGSTLSADLVKANLDRRSDPTLLAYTSFAEGGASEIAEVTSPDQSTVVITFAQPTASAVSLLGDLAGRIVGQSAIDDPTILQTTPVGSGPYTLGDESIKGNTYVLTKNDDSWNADAYPYETVTFKILEDSQALANALVSGQLQVATVDTTTLSMVEGNASVARFPGATFGFLLFDKLGTISEPFGDVRVRQALSLALDRESLASLNAEATATANAFPEGTTGHDPSLDEEHALDVERAKALLADAGFADGFEFDTWVAGTIYTADLQTVQQQWAEIGVTMNIVQVSEPQNAPTETPLGYFTYTVGSDPLSWVTGFLLGRGVNRQGATSDAIDAAVSAAQSGQGNADTEALTDLNRAIVNEGWFTPAYTQPVFVGYDPEAVAAPELASPTTAPLLSSIVPAN